jgi:glyoxylase-like metal-dependent hydrolase (beta-lactamase superfamily II)
MKRRDALKAMAGMAAASALGRMAGASELQGPSEDVSLPELIRQVGPMMESTPIQVASLGGNLSIITGPGGNITALTGRDGIVLIDSFVPAKGPELAPIVRKLAPGPITLINTHWHFDHTGGNAALAGIGARILAHESVRGRLGSEQYMAEFDMKIPPSPAAALPVIGLGESTTLYLNGEETHIQHVAPAHTDGDLFIHYRKADVLQTGDLFSNGFYPNIDSNSGGWITGMIAAADLILGLVGEKTRIVPGHGPMATKADLKAFRSMLAEVRDKVAPLVDAGKTLDQSIAAKPLASLDAQWGRGLFKGTHFTNLAYRGLAMHRGQK